MAKQYNIIRLLKQEIRKGNIFIDTNGNFVNEEKIQAHAKEQFLKGMRNGTIPMTTSCEEFCKTYAWNLLKADILLAELSNMGVLIGGEQDGMADTN